MKMFRTVVSVFCLFLFLQACSNQAVHVYEESSYGVPLEVPPDLIKPSLKDELSILRSTDKSDSSGKNPQSCACDTAMPVLPEQGSVQLHRDAGQRWLTLQGEPKDIWPWIRDFWLKNDFQLSIEDPLTGLVETDWKQLRKNLPMEGEKAAEQDKHESRIYSVPTREKFRVRLEPGEQSGSTDLFLTHRGVELLADGKLIVWKLRASDLELESEMLRRLMLFLGIEQQKQGGSLAGQARHLKYASIIENNKQQLLLKVDVEFARIWRRAGLILDRMNFIIEDRNRSVGTYKVKHKDPLKDEDVKEEKGWFSSMFSGDSQVISEYKIVLRDEGSSTHIAVLDVSGKPVDKEVSKKILEEMLGYLQ